MNLFESDLTETELRVLFDCCDKAPGETYMEIGVYAGGTLNKVCQRYAFHNFIGVDLFEDFKKEPGNTHIGETMPVERLREALPEHKQEQIKLLKIDSRELLAHITYGFSGLVFIDGNHTYNATLIDFLNAHMLLQYGYILIHNASNDRYPDKTYVEADGGPYAVVEFAKKLNDLEYIGTFDRLAVFRK